MNFKTNLCLFSILGILAILAILVHFGSDFLFPILKTNPSNNTSGLSVSGEGQPKALQANRKGNTEKHDSRTTQEVASVSSATLSSSDGEKAALSSSDGESPFYEYESIDTPIDSTLEETSLEDEEHFVGEDRQLQEEILAAEEKQNQYVDPEPEYEMTEEEQDEVEASLVAASLAPPVEDEPFYEDAILQEEEAVIDESAEAWQEEQEEDE